MVPGWINLLKSGSLKTNPAAKGLRPAAAGFLVYYKYNFVVEKAPFPGSQPGKSAFFTLGPYYIYSVNI